MDMREEERRRRAARRRRQEQLRKRRARIKLMLVVFAVVVVAVVYLLLKAFSPDSEVESDKTAPIVYGKNITVLKGAEVKPEDLVEKVVEENKYELSFENEPDVNNAGVQKLVVLATDKAGNVGKVEVELNVYDDTTAPVITGTRDIAINIGSTVSYKKDVTVTDDYDTNVELVIDNSKVDLNKIGEYPVVYKAKDTAGNEASVEVVLTVVAADAPTEDMVYALCDQILSQIINDSMTDKEKAEKIYYWVHDSIGYVEDSPKDSWVEGAYRGLKDRKGDCYTYATTAKALLTRAGIKNMDIAKIPAKERHYWNLIDVGEGWYHFDTTRRKDGTIFFYWDDAKLMEYSNRNNLSHNYDRSLYPEIQ